MRWPPAPVRRLAVGLAVIAALFTPSAATLWIWSPDAGDVQLRVTQLTQSYGIPLLSELEVPPLLADAVVATEDERFYSHHGSIRSGLRALFSTTWSTSACARAGRRSRSS